MKRSNRRLLRLSVLTLLPSAVACATATTNDSEESADSGSGGEHSDRSRDEKSSGGGGDPDNASSEMDAGNTGGARASGGRNSLSSGGRHSTGGASSGGMGGTSGSGDLGTGGVGTGGLPFEGDCAGKPSFNDPSVEYEDFAVYTCDLQHPQGSCTEAINRQPALFQCNQSHANNCRTQAPRDGSSWTLVGLCSELGMGGQGGALF